MFYKICQICSIVFESKASNAKYCPECRKDVKNWRRQDARKREAAKAKKQEEKKPQIRQGGLAMETNEKSDLIQMAEQNVLNRVGEAQNWIKIMRAVNYAGMSFFPGHTHDTCAESWYRGMRMAEDALYHKLCEYQAEAMLFVGVGGKETEKFAREKFRERFGLDEDGKHYEIMSLLDQYLDVPGGYLVDDEIEFRKQAKDAYEATDGATTICTINEGMK